MDEREPPTEPGSDSEKPEPQRTPPPPPKRDSEPPSTIPEQEWLEADRLQADPWGTKHWCSPLKRKNPCTKRSGDGAKPKFSGKLLPSKGASCKRPIWISERDWLEAGPSGTQQRHIPSKRYKSPAKPSGDGERPKTQGTLHSSRSAPSKRPSWMSEQDWLGAGPSGTKSGSSPLKRSGRGHTPAKTSATRRTTTEATRTTSGLPRRRLRYPEDLSRQYDRDGKEDGKEHVAVVDPVRSGEGQPSEADPADLFARAFDEVASTALVSQEILASWCASLSDDDQPSGDDPPS